ncbi:hypothetical protein DB35_04555 [Streptomyces abyssalis]|uniref:Uncharacterized protein n=1 Tax=Streptomyces abyssalis TaxID=933944 RepID=A0A1E7JQB0_9ACTN|nr:hypothetical protein [Streptomyces abyssalis]OEU90477.1 hypothetical protein AN215_13645 [Streptomyces abyssalis]OEU95214.1 hypothetical protein DB35_04555 [Streptomyces abyssalis]OEV28653.1 hypothetical protein AN219_20250 [Streptomyces nanshensis]
MKCIRCEARGVVLVHQVDAGNMQGINPGPRTGDVYACRPHAREIAALPGSWPWLAAETRAKR